MMTPQIDSLIADFEGKKRYTFADDMAQASAISATVVLA
jgi:hypothetical protein